MSVLRNICIIYLAIFALQSCSDNPTEVDTSLPVPQHPPEWSKEAIWYQIFVERFANGDPSNDPTLQSIAGTYPGFIPENWAPTPWTQDWYKEDPYFEQVHGKLDFYGNPITSFDAKTALRRYGGDLQGVLNKLDYLQDLGVTALYFNPINDAPSMHKYDARHWRHVDVNFGPTPNEDREIIADETPYDPSTWEFTNADKLFLQVIKEAKSRGIRVILDYSWNHTGHTFWAWQDVLKKQQESEFSDWYWVKQFDDPNTADNEFSYRGWFGVSELPEIKETEYADHSQKLALLEGNIYSQAAKDHIFAITRRWLDPNGDGDPSDGVDGFRLDVAAEVPLGFWRDYRNFVKRVNPEAYLVGEIWWEEFPDKLFDPAPVLQGDIFDAAMNYRWFRHARKFFASAPEQISAPEYATLLQNLDSNIGADFSAAMMNMSASHDSPRLLTSLLNKNKYKFEAKESQNIRYNAGAPNNQTYAQAKLLLAHQFTFVGAPQIWAGDEMGMWGSDDPHNRKPLTWPELEFETESVHPLKNQQDTHRVGFNSDYHEYYQSLIKLRKSDPVFSVGQIEYMPQEVSEQVLTYRRFMPDTELSTQAWIALNTSKKAQELTIPTSILNSQTWTLWESDSGVMRAAIPAEELTIKAQTAIVILAN